jgi:hypothetical protein
MVGDREGRFFFQNALTGVTRLEPGCFFYFFCPGVRLNTVQLGIPLVAHFQALVATHLF